MKRLFFVAVVAWVSMAASLAEEYGRPMSILDAVGLAERALSGEVAPNRATLNRFRLSLAETSRYCDGNGVLHGAPAWAKAGIVGDVEEKVSLSVNAAYAEELKLAGLLLGCPSMRADGLALASEIRRRNGGRAVVYRDAEEVSGRLASFRRLSEDVKSDLRRPVRPGGDGAPFWNRQSRFFMYPPSFDFREVAGAATYRYRVTDDLHRRHVFDAETPHAPLVPVWEELVEGFVTVDCMAFSADGRMLGVSGERKFWKTAPFDPAGCPSPIRSYAEARRRVVDYLYGWREIDELERNGCPDISEKSNFTSYPSKMLSAVVLTMIAVEKEFPERAERARRIARIAADYLVSKSQPKGSPLEFFPPTYEGTGQLSGTYAGEVMLLYPAKVGEALVALYECVGDEKYLIAAENIAKTYIRLQGDDGTWFLKMRTRDGSPVSGNRVVPNGVIAFLERIFAVTGRRSYRVAADKAFGFIDQGPLKTWNWEGQFEDIRPASCTYENLTKHNACDTAIYLVGRFPGDAKRLSEARELLRFAEDQFVVWRRPCRMDGSGLGMPTHPYSGWKTPAALEQYKCYYPIDASAGKLIRAYLALWKADGRELDLAKAKALGNSMVNVQDESGRIRTYWIPEAGDASDPLAGAFRRPLGGDWYNCMADDARTLSMLDEASNSAERIRR